MKCVCGHECVRGWPREHDTGEPFIKIDGKFTIEREGNWQSYIKDVRLYACPKCHTVQADVDAL